METTNKTGTGTAKRLDFFIRMIENGTVSNVTVNILPLHGIANVTFGFDTDDGTESSDVNVECTVGEAVEFLIPAIEGYRKHKESSWTEEDEAKYATFS